MKEVANFANDSTDRLRETANKGGEGAPNPENFANVINGYKDSTWLGEILFSSLSKSRKKNLKPRTYLPTKRAAQEPKAWSVGLMKSQVIIQSQSRRPILPSNFLQSSEQDEGRMETRTSLPAGCKLQIKTCAT